MLYLNHILNLSIALLPDGTDDRGATAKRVSIACLNLIQQAHVPQLMGFPPETPDAEPEVVASAVSYLCKPEAHFITGQTISIDGGIRMS